MVREFPIFIGDVPAYQVIDGHMHITWRELEIVLPVSVMQEAIASAKSAIDEWRCDQFGKVEQIAHWRSHPS